MNIYDVRHVRFFKRPFHFTIWECISVMSKWSHAQSLWIPVILWICGHLRSYCFTLWRPFYQNDNSIVRSLAQSCICRRKSAFNLVKNFFSVPKSCNMHVITRCTIEKVHWLRLIRDFFKMDRKALAKFINFFLWTNMPKVICSYVQ